MFFLALGLGASIGVWRGLRPALEKLFPERKLIVRPPALRLSLVKVETQRITDDTLERLRVLPGVGRVDPQMPATFPLHAEGKFGPMPEPIVTEIVVHGVPRDLVADSIPESESFEWTLEEVRPCPVVVSSYFLDLYNLGISESNRLPKLNESALRGKTFTLVLGESVIATGAGFTPSAAAFSAYHDSSSFALVSRDASSVAVSRLTVAATPASFVSVCTDSTAPLVRLAAPLTLICAALN